MKGIELSPVSFVKINFNIQKTGFCKRELYRLINGERRKCNLKDEAIFDAYLVGTKR